MKDNLSVTLLHELPGRVRIKLSVRPPNLSRFTDSIMSHDGFETAQFNSISKSLLITYETGHLTTEEILLRAAVSLSMEYDYAPVKVHLAGGAEIMTDGAIIAGLFLLFSGAFQFFGKGRSSYWLNRITGMAVALAVGEHGWREARERGYIHPEILSVGYLFSSWYRGNILRGATVTWVASFGRHLLQGPEKSIDVRPVSKHYEKNEPRTYQISLVPMRQQKSALLRWSHGILGIFGLGGIGGLGSTLYEEIQNMAQAHDRVLEGLNLQPNGIPITFRKEFQYEH